MMSDSYIDNSYDLFLGQDCSEDGIEGVLCMGSLGGVHGRVCFAGRIWQPTCYSRLGVRCGCL